MIRENIGLLIFRYLLLFGLFFFWGMLYWSSALLEKDMKEVQNTLLKIKREVSGIQGFIEKGNFSLTSPSLKTITNRPHIDPSLPNLLQIDPFYEKTLPELLGKDFIPQGTFQDETIGKPSNLHPFSGWRHVSDWNSQCTVSVGRSLFGKYEEYSPYMALKVEERRDPKTQIPEYWIHLRDDVFWQPLDPSFFPNDFSLGSHFLEKHRVTAHDFKFFYDAVMNPYVQEMKAITLKMYLANIEEFKVIDDYTFVIRWKTKEIKQPDGSVLPTPQYAALDWTLSLQPLPSFVYRYFADGTKIVEDDQDPDTYRKNSVWAQNFVRHFASQVIVSCGPWIFDGLSDKEIRFRRNEDFFNHYSALAEKMVIGFKEAPESIWQSFKAGKIDSYSIQPDLVRDYEEFLLSTQYAKQEKNNLRIDRLDYVARSFSYIGWNINTPFFQQRKVRQAMTMAIDRKRIIEQILNGMGIEITGPFFPYSEAYDPFIQPWPYDPIRAKQLLQQEGWFDTDGDGFLDKEIDGKRIPFRFSLTYFVKNSTTKAICEYISTALKEIGVDCRLNGVDLTDLSAIFDDRSFEALCLAWSLGTPPEDPKQLWHSSGAHEKGSSNMVGFMNQEADQIIEALQYEYDREKRISLYHRFHQIIHQEAPYTFLYSPKVAMLYRQYLQNVFLPIQRQDLIPGAIVQEPQPQIFWLRKS